MQNLFAKIRVPLLNILFTLLVSLGVVYFFALHVPLDMDEFTQYHTIGCQYYPQDQMNIFRESCLGYDLAVFGDHYLPLRAYHYQGSFPALLYFPLFLLWKSPHSARLLGLLIMAVQSLCLRRLFRVPYLPTFLLLVCMMPYAFQHVVDTGVIPIQITSLLLVCVLVQEFVRCLENPRWWMWMYPVLAGLCVFIGIWTKLAYFATIPGTVLIILYYLFRDKALLSQSATRLKLIGCFMVVALTAGALSFLLLNAKTRMGEPYIAGQLDVADPIGLFEFVKLIGNFLQLTLYLIHPIMTAHKSFEIPLYADPWGIAHFLILILFFCLGIYLLRRQKIKIFYVVFNIALFALTFLILVKMNRSNAMHHVMLCFPFFLLAFFYIFARLYRQRIIVCLLIGFLITNFALYWQLTKLPFNEADPPMPTKWQLNQVIDEVFADHYVIIIVDWGMYYLKSLYGNKNQIVLYIEPLTSKKQLRQINHILQITNRKAVFVSRVPSASNIDLIHTYFPNLLLLDTLFDTYHWRVWYES